MTKQLHSFNNMLQDPSGKHFIGTLLLVLKGMGEDLPHTVSILKPELARKLALILVISCSYNKLLLLTEMSNFLKM